MMLSEFLESKFRGDIRFRGAAYLKAERVTITRVTADDVFAVVRDGIDYQTQLRREENQLRMHCNCAGDQQHDMACKHLWATILSVEEGGFLTGSIKPGYIPPFATEAEPLHFDEDDWDEDELGDVFHPPGSTGPAASRPVEVQPPLRPWESQLRDLRREMESGEPASAAAAREKEIFYEIDVAESRTAGQLVIETSQRQRRANGQWGKPKPLKLRTGRLDEIEHEDHRKILTCLTGGTPERTNWYAQQAELQASVHRYHIPYELCLSVLPLMCATGQVRYLGSDEKTQTPPVWDDGPPWELLMRLVFDEDEGCWRLDGQLSRGEETMPINRAKLLIPGGLVLTETAVARLEDFEAFEWVSLLERERSLSVPAGEEHDLADQLLDMPTLPRLELPEELRLQEIHCDPVPHLVIHSPRGVRWQRERLHGQVQFDYLGTLIEGGSSQWAIVQRQEGRCVLRNRQREEEAWSQLLEQGFRRLFDSVRARGRNRYDIEILAGELGPAVRALIGAGWQVRADGKQVRQPGEMQFRVQTGIDWFELHAHVDFEGSSVGFPELLSALARGDSTVRLSDGSLGIVPEEWLEQYGLLTALGTAEEDHIRFAQNQVALLDALLATQTSVDYDEKFSQLREQFCSFGGVSPSDEPAGFRGRLRGYQKEGLGWLEFLETFRFGGCLADDMGLGKTVQLLAALEHRRAEADEHRPSLVVVPKSLLFNWQQECSRFTPKLKVVEYTGLDRFGLRKEFHRYDLVLTTYGTLRRDIIDLKEIRFDYVVLDEAQIIKNAGSQVAKASRLLQADHRMALSGTPVENHLGDLWSIFEFLNPGMLGRSSIFKLYADDVQDQESKNLLAAGLRPFILRRTKKQVASELPEKLEQTIYCDMDDEQRQLYNEMRDHYRNSLLGLVEAQGLAKSKMHVLEALLRLRQAACHPALLDKQSQEKSSAKLDVLCPHLEELLDEGHKSLVFSQFTSMLAIVRAHLDKRNIVYEYLDGKTRNRQACVERFQTDPDCGVFLISLKAGGLGLNLTAADYVFLLDPWWNPAVEAQAIDRAHRVGQTRQVFAYRLICKGTVEEKIAELQTKKRALAEAILEADQTTVLKDLSTEDLELLLS